MHCARTDTPFCQAASKGGPKCARSSALFDDPEGPVSRPSRQRVATISRGKRGSGVAHSPENGASKSLSHTR
eukprot:1139901-Pleurochrysis_carterae.AAC.3